MRLFSRKKRTAIGLDIGYASVKGLEVTENAGQYVVDKFGTVPIDLSVEPSKRGEAVVKAIQTLCKKVGFSTNRAVVSVNGESVIVRVLRMPYFSEKEKDQLDFAVKTEARDFIPFDMEDVAFDYQRLGVLQDGPDGKALEVLIVAAQKDLVRWHTDVLKAAGLEPVIVDVGSFALVNAVHHGADLTPETPVALVDIGSALTNIAIMKGDTTRFTRDLSTAGWTITKAIVNELGMTPQEAEAAKVEHGISMEEQDSESEDLISISQSNLTESMETFDLGEATDFDTSDTVDQQVHAICEQFLGEIVSEIKRCLLFYENQLDGEPVEKVYLTGGTVKMRNADRYVENLLDTPVEILDPFKKVAGAISHLDPIERGCSYAISLGLALRSVIGEGVS